MPHRPDPATPRRHTTWLAGATVVLGLLVGGCAVEWQNRQAAQEMQQRAQAPGSVYAGWRVYQDKCVTCHGPAASGTAQGPDLLPRLRDLGPRQFVSLVLKRYDWSLPATQTQNSAALDTLVDDIMQRQGPVLLMPAWEGEPRVSAHIMDLYAYLSARSEGKQGPGKPQP